MNNFIDFAKEMVNLSKIREIRKESDSVVRVRFDNGDEKLYNTYGDADSAIRRLENTIIQLIPCPPNIPLFNVFRDYDGEQGTYFYEPVACLVLCADGTVRSLIANEFFDLSTESSNFVGCFQKCALSNFPESPPSEEGKHGI